MNKEFFKNYSHKIKTIQSLKSLISKSKQKFIFCHGVFDIVHPGHVRHLVYAKSIANKLIVSITSDKHINKGIYRPHIPERIRALNLAAFEMVDYVIIDTNTKPIENLKKLKPHFFAKGFEYSSDGLPKATQEEAKVVRSYGGKIIFTPGDIVYSSSNFLGDHLPKIKYEKLLELMHSNKITFNKLRNTIKDFNKYSAHVIGDTIVDTYTRTKFIGGQTKTPTFSVLYNGEDNYIGGAGIVAQHIKAAGAKVNFTTVIGKDALGKFVAKKLKQSKINCSLLVDSSRPTINKNVFIASDYRLLKVDTLDNNSINEDIQNHIITNIKKIKSDAIVFSDFRHGIFNQLTIDKFIKNIPKKIFKVGDSQVASRWGNITEFKNFDLITPNEREARFSLADQDSTVGKICDLLHTMCNYKNLILKLGPKGIFCNHFSNNNKNSYFSLDAFTENVKDPVGSGDALLAYATLTMLSTKSLLISSIIGSIAAACECEFDGNIPVKQSDVLSKINSIEKESKYKSI